MSVLLGFIADDFTGAADLAGLRARSGARVSLSIGVPTSKPGDDVAPFEVIALKSRTAPVGEAVVETRAALRWLQAAGARRFFWKYCSTFDSTAEGNIGLVAEAHATCAMAARNAGARHFVVAGGETSGAVTNALKVMQLDIGQEIAPVFPGHSVIRMGIRSH